MNDATPTRELESVRIPDHASSECLDVRAAGPGKRVTVEFFPPSPVAYLVGLLSLNDPGEIMLTEIAVGGKPLLIDAPTDASELGIPGAMHRCIPTPHVPLSRFAPLNVTFNGTGRLKLLAFWRHGQVSFSCWAIEGAVADSSRGVVQAREDGTLNIAIGQALMDVPFGVLCQLLGARGFDVMEKE